MCLCVCERNRIIVYIIGNNDAAIRIMIRPTMPIIVFNGDKVFNASLSVRLLTLHTIQKPASFIHGTSLEPQPIASPIYTGLYCKCALLAMPARIPEVVISATVAEPCAVLMMAATKNESGMSAI